MKNCNILVVEDEALIAASLVHTLSSLGYTVPEPVATGEEAIRAVKTQHPDLVLMDIQLAGEMDGIETAGKIRAIADIPVVYLTAHTDDLRLKQAQLTEPYGYIVKPTHNRELHATIEMALYKHALDRKLKESEERFRTIIHSMQFGIVIIDAQTHTILDANKKALEIIGGTSDIVSGSVCHRFLCPAELGMCPVTDLKQTVDSSDRVLLTLQGKKIPIIKSVISTTLEGKEVLIESFVDIAERKQMEEILRESEERFRSLFDSALDMIQIIRPDGSFLHVNPAWKKTLGYSDDDIRKMSVFDVFHPDSLRHCSIIFRELLGGAEALNIEAQFLTKDKKTISVEGNCTPELNGGTVVSIRGIFHDITERKQTDLALRQANKQLNLLSTITRHDILNQLLALRGYLELSREYLGDNKTLSDFVAKEEKISKTIDDQISFTRDYQSLGAAVPEWQNVNENIRIAMVALPMRAVHVEPDPADPEVYADPLFEKVFYNLIDNALRYGSSDMKTIRISSQESGTSLTIFCEDDGVGISNEDKKRLFTKGFGKNTGLGLFLSREILAITGITISENGTPGKGARFEIIVPKGAYRFTGTGG